MHAIYSSIPQYDPFYACPPPHPAFIHRAQAGDPEAAHKYSSRSDRDSCQACNLANSFLSLPHVTVSDRAGMFGLFLSGACRLCRCGWLLLQSYHFNSLVAAVGL